ncbi:MAG TPA: hypothetical protein VNZ45_12505 [Bacteroidia bacterium]|nr:hypothetical protein [Bacteroidia bacterium]
MKIRLLFILILLFFCASSVIARNEAIPAHRDSIVKTFKLKNGYRLVYKATDTANIVLVEKGKESNNVGEQQADPKMPLEVLGYLYADFENTFALATHIDADPIKIVVFDKKTGGMLIYGKSPFYLDTIKGILMYEGAYGKAGKLVLYDSRTGKSELFQAPNDTPCFCCCCWKTVELTDKELKIEYMNMKNEKTIKIYARK